MHPEPGQALGPQRLGPVGEGVEPGPAERGAALDHDGLHARGAEGLDLGALEHRGQVDQLHAEAQVGLVGAVPVDGLGPGHARDVGRALAGDRLGGVEHGLGHEAEHVLLADEGGLHVELGELELPVGPQVLVPQAPGDLVVAVHAGHHQQLLGQLGALGQDVAATRGQPAGHGELAGPLGGRRPQQRRLHLDESLAVHGRPQGAG